MIDNLYTSVKRSTSATNKKDKLNNCTLNQQPDTGSTGADQVFHTSIRIRPTVTSRSQSVSRRKVSPASVPLPWRWRPGVGGQLTRGAPPPPARWSGAGVPDTGCTVQCHCVPLPPPTEAPPPWGSAQKAPGRGRSQLPRPLCRG